MKSCSLFLLLCALTPLAGADTAGPFEPLRYDRGIVFQHPEGQYAAALRFRMQNLTEVTSRSADSLEPARVQAQVRRLRLRLQGFAVDPRLTYQLQLSFSRSDQDFSSTQFSNVVRDANIAYALLRSDDELLQVSYGQGKLPGNRQRVISSGDQQFADRSIVNGTFNIDRDFGFQALYRRSRWNLRGSVTTGEGRNLTNSSDHGLAYVGRAEILPFGAFTDENDAVESDQLREERPRLSLGASLARFKNSNRAGGTIGTVYTTTGNPLTGSPIRRDQSVILTDGLFKWKGYSLYGEWARRGSDQAQVSATESLFVGTGWLVQTGYMISEKWEIAARHARILPKEVATIDAANRRTGQYTVGANYFIQGHRVKLQTDLTRQTWHQPSWIARFNFELGI